MKIFLSWSGTRSKEVANLLDQWIRCVIQVARPWNSNRDLDRGSVWFSEINDQLKDTTTGIICITQENKNRPWILFEAGALAKGLSTSRVCTLLIDLHPKDIEDPLAQFNHTFPTKESMEGLIKNLNKSLGNSSLDMNTIDKVFNTYWPQFIEEFDRIIKNTTSESPPKPRPKDDVLGEILENTRNMASRIRNIEYDLERSGIKSKKKFTEVFPKSAIDIHKSIEKLINMRAPREFIINQFKDSFSIDEINEIIKLYVNSQLSEISDEKTRNHQ